MKTESEIRADERRKCVEEIRAMNKAAIGREWVGDSLWANIIERAARTIEPKQESDIAALEAIKHTRSDPKP